MATDRPDAPNTPIVGYTVSDLAAARVAVQRREFARAHGALDPMDLEDIDRALDSLENPDGVESMPAGDALALIRSILADYRPTT